MQVNHFSHNIYSQNKCLKQTPIAFGELDDDDRCIFNEKRKPKDSDYYIEMDEINEKYNKERYSLYRHSDDRGASSSTFWEQLDKIEKARRAELEYLKSKY